MHSTQDPLTDKLPREIASQYLKKKKKKENANAQTENTNPNTYIIAD